MPPNDLRVKPFNPKVYAQIYKNAGRTYGKYIKKAQDDVDYWKKKYESWRWKIPKARELNYSTELPSISTATRRGPPRKSQEKQKKELPRRRPRQRSLKAS